MNQSARWLSLGLLLTSGFLLGILGFSVWEKIPTTVERVVWSPTAQWIAPQSPTYRFYTRYTLNLPEHAAAGWLRLSADNDFTLYVNGVVVARENSALNSSLGLSAGISIPSPDFNDSNPYQIQTANYLIASSHDWKLTTYVDLTAYLRPGKNVIGLEIQKGQTNPRVVVEGAVYPVAEANPIKITSNVTWRVSNLSETRQSLQWFDVDFADENWPVAQVLGAVKEATYSCLSKNLFDRPLQGSWLTGNVSPKGEVWLRGLWQIPVTKIHRAYIRFAGQSEYSLLLNGSLVNKYQTNDHQELNLFAVEVTKLLLPGDNVFAVRLAKPLIASSVSNPYNPDGSVEFLLDGWAETKTGEIVGEVATDRNWTSLTKSIKDGNEGAVEAIILGLPQSELFQRHFSDNAYLLNYPNYLYQQGLWQLGAIACILIYALMIGFWLGRQNFWDSLQAGTGILSLPTLYLIGIGLLKHRYAEAEVGLLFAQPQSNSLILIGFIGIVLFTLLWSQNTNGHGGIIKWFCFGLIACISLGLASGSNVLSIGIALMTILMLLRGRWHQDSYGVLKRAWESWGKWFLLVLIISIGFGLRVYHLDWMDLETDENTSLDATRGILRMGAPITTSGVWYSRGPVYHYLLALWLRFVGDSIANARFLSAILGTATLILVFILGHKITGRFWIALIALVILTIDPWELYYAQNIRFYQLWQFLAMLSVWSFIKGFIDREGKRYQCVFFIAITLTLLTQEIGLTLLPAFLCGFLYFYRPFNLFQDWQIVLGSAMTITIFVFDLGFAAIRLLSPLPAIADSTASYLRLHFNDITKYSANFLISSDRMHTLYTVFFLIGFAYFIKRRHGLLIFLFSIVFIKVILVTILCYDTAERYGYSVYPLFVLLAVYSTISIAASLGQKYQQILQGMLPLRAIASFFAVLLLFSNIEPVRTLAGYQEAINRRNTQIFAYISTHKHPDDVVISPLPSVAVTKLGHLDYFLMGTGYFDATYWHDGRLIDRWAGGVVINSIDQMNSVLEKSHRVWIHLEDSRETRFNPQTWKYMESLGKPVVDTFCTRLRLWQPEDGIPIRLPNSGKDLGAY